MQCAYQISHYVLYPQDFNWLRAAGRGEIEVWWQGTKTR